MKHYLITGGAGFIGSNLVRELLKNNEKVTVWDNLYTGRINNIKDLLTNTNFNFVNVDITNDPDQIGFEKNDIWFADKYDQTFDYIVNLACVASPDKYQKNPVHTMMTCVLGMKNMLDIATQLNIPILQASTSEVYGDPKETPQSEEYRGNTSCIGPRSCYDVGKMAAESLCFDYHRKHGTQVKVIRIFNTYGPYMARDDGRVVSNFITQILAGKSLTIYGDGQQTRSLCYIDDLIRGLMLMLHSPKEITGPFNIGNDTEKTILEIAEIVISLSGKEGVIEFKHLPTDDPTNRCPNLEKIGRTFGWKPIISLEEGLKKTFDYFK